MIRRASNYAAWIRNDADRRAVAHGCYLDLAAAERVREFFATFLCHSKGEFAGQPFRLLDWQWRDIVAPLFGWKQADGRRRFRTAYIEVPKKNGKSTLGAGLALYLLLADGEPGAEVYSAASDRDQASLVFNEAANMVEASEGLKSHLGINRTTKTIWHRPSQSTYKALSADAHRNQGQNIHGLIFDELHAQPSRELWDALRYGGAARRQPLLVSITTAGYDRHSICWEQHEYAEKVLAGVVEDDSFFAYLAAAPDNADWTDPAVWRAANPSYGVMIQEDQFASDCLEARESPAKENAFRRYRLNQWTTQETRWLSLDAWDACRADLDERQYEKRPCYVGLDLASTVDLTACVLLFPRDDGCDLLPYFFCPRDTAREREHKDRVPYTQWMRDGWLLATEGNAVDYERVRLHLNDLAARFKIREIGVDPWNAHHISTQLAADGFKVTGVRQGTGSMSGPSKALERLVLQRKLRHNGHPVLRWNASNVAVRTDSNGNYMPCKTKSREKIDGIVATIIALAVSGLAVDKTSIYSKGRGLLSV